MRPLMRPLIDSFAIVRAGGKEPEMKRVAIVPAMLAVQVRIFGDTAVVMGSDDESSAAMGKSTTGHYTWTDVWVRRNGRWQAMASQMTIAPKR